MIVLHFKAHWAALAGLLTAIAVAVIVLKMPVQMAGMAAVHGLAYGLFPIGWIVLGALFLYDVTVKSGDFEIVKHTIGGLASDRRIQALLIAFCFGAFIEGAAGFGTASAISAAMLIGIGFRPLEAAKLSLIANTAPVAFGALGIPVTALAGVAGVPLLPLSATVGRQLVPFCILIPFWLVWTLAGRKATFQIWPACLTAGGVFCLAQFLISNFHGPWAVDVGASIISLLALVVLLKFWKPKSVWSFDFEKASERATEEANRPVYSTGRKVKAWMPWVILSAFVFLWGLPQTTTFLDGGPEKAPNFLNHVSKISYKVPALNDAVIRTVPVVPKPTPRKAVYVLNWLSATGTSLVLAGIVSGLFLSFSLSEVLRIFFGTMKRIRLSLLTIGTMLALGFTISAAGLDATMGLAFASTGVLFPFFSPILGWLGVALTGSDTSSNVLFGGLQKITANQLGVSPMLAAAANSTGGVMGKMISAQSIVVASAATGLKGGEGDILRSVFWHSIALVSIAGVLIFLQAYVFPWITPVMPK
jgi:lactate permease